jgi:hypothetical protein
LKKIDWGDKPRRLSLKAHRKPGKLEEKTVIKCAKTAIVYDPSDEWSELSERKTVSDLCGEMPKGPKSTGSGEIVKVRPCELKQKQKLLDAKTQTKWKPKKLEVMIQTSLRGEDHAA